MGVASLQLLLMASLPIFADPKPAEWKAGIAMQVITPKRPMWMAGYGNRNKPADEMGSGDRGEDHRQSAGVGKGSQRQNSGNSLRKSVFSGADNSGFALSLASLRNMSSNSRALVSAGLSRTASFKSAMALSCCLAAA